MKNNKIKFALDKKGRKVVVINEILFYGKRRLPWKEVRKYLKRYVGEIVKVEETEEKIYIHSDFPDEYTGSQDTVKAKSASAKAKANAAQGVREMIKISRKTKEMKNYKRKNNKMAKHGWFRYLTRFAVPVLNEDSIIERYNVYLATLVVRKSKNGKLYLYDLVNVKKEDSVDFFA